MALALLLAMIGSVAVAEESDGVTCIVQITSGNLNIRERPLLKSKAVGSLEASDRVVAIGYDGGWTLVEAPVEAGAGWVKSEFLTTSTDGYGDYANSSGGRVRLRNGVGGESLGWLPAGKRVTVSAWAEDMNGEHWAYVGKGYVMAQYLSKVE